MNRIEDGRVIGNILRLMSALIVKPQETMLNPLPEPRKQKFYCPRMNVRVTMCRMTSCSYFKKCMECGGAS